ncbi:hypothetical protein M407DRAFT_244620 [Tulasnella calospora MUT 4182]|uniref:Uncharacterized protein n=1 Tax=Tulasnella calospora MUT 4182 TaxID=1051891 RepID=A0A0C3Q4M8_9AGAM|nr:hypothetical protein M407DRAFT_244620 [Tulasnella calospora MUT 4182]
MSKRGRYDIIYAAVLACNLELPDALRGVGFMATLDQFNTLWQRCIKLEPFYPN